MTISVPGYSRVLLLTGVLMFTPMQFSDSGMSFNVAMANNAGGNGNDKGQGQSQAGSNGKGKGGTASAGVGRSPGKASNHGRISAVGAMTQYSAALSAFKTVDATDDPTAQELAAILAKIATKDELTSETIDWIHQQLLNSEMVTQTTLDEAASILAPAIDPNAESAVATATPTLSELLAEQVSLIQESKSNKGLGPIY